MIALLALAASAGCATTERATFSSRFVREGTPTIDLGGPPPERRAPIPSAAASHAITENIARSSGGTLEASDPQLRNALARVTIAPTIEHHLAVSRAYRENGIMDHALDYLNRSLAVNGPSAAVYDARARLWRDWGNPDFGLADAYRAISLAPKDPALRNTLGTLLYRLGHTKDAEAQFTAAVALDGKAWYALSNLCQISLAAGRTRDAIAQCRQADSLRPKHTATSRKARP